MIPGQLGGADARASPAELGSWQAAEVSVTCGMLPSASGTTSHTLNARANSCRGCKQGYTKLSAGRGKPQTETEVTTPNTQQERNQLQQKLQQTACISKDKCCEHRVHRTTCDILLNLIRNLNILLSFLFFFFPPNEKHALLLLK